MSYIKFWRDLKVAVSFAAVCVGGGLISGCISSDSNSHNVVVEDAKSSHRSSSASDGSISVKSNTRTTKTVSKSQTYREQPLGSTDTPAGGTDYRVVQGDTLFSIAFRYGQNYQTLAQENGIEPPYNIKVGQVIHVNGGQSATVASTSGATTTSETYIVKKGDTLTSVAASHNLPPSAIVRVNNLSYPYKLKVGDRLTLEDPDAKRSETKSATQKEVVVAGKTASESSSEVTPVSEIKVVSGRTRTAGGVTWMWPAQGKVVKGFSLAENGNKGIDIAGSRGQNVMSAADGQVVYSGSALRGYGKLIIINHSNEYLSAYAHNDELLVTEGQKIKRGQVIAKMGSTDASRVQLHFEIRYKGKSVNPLGYLPK